MWEQAVLSPWHKTFYNQGYIVFSFHLHLKNIRAKLVETKYNFLSGRIVSYSIPIHLKST